MTAMILQSSSCCNVLHAQAIVAPTGVSASSTAVGAPINLGDQSGLSATYISTVTLFDLFLSTTTHDQNSNSNAWASGDNTNEFIDFDFGESIDLTRLALFADDSPNGNNIQDFSVLISNDPTFATSTNLGSFTASDTNPNPITAQVYDVLDGSGQFVRLLLTDNHGGDFGFDSFVLGEAIFEGTSSAVPEPSSFLMIAGLCIGVLVRRNRT